MNCFLNVARLISNCCNHGTREKKYWFKIESKKRKKVEKLTGSK